MLLLSVRFGGGGLWIAVCMTDRSLNSRCKFCESLSDKLDAKYLQLGESIFYDLIQKICKLFVPLDFALAEFRKPLVLQSLHLHLHVRRYFPGHNFFGGKQRLPGRVFVRDVQYVCRVVTVSSRDYPLSFLSFVSPRRSVSAQSLRRRGVRIEISRFCKTTRHCRESLPVLETSVRRHISSNARVSRRC